jgi:hypothetical protein
MLAGFEKERDRLDAMMSGPQRRDCEDIGCDGGPLQVSIR